MTELSKKIIESQNVRESFKSYLRKVISDLKDVDLTELESEIKISESFSHGDFFWALAVALEEISMETNGEVFSDYIGDLNSMIAFKKTLENKN